jgi:hypothetical protein
MGLTTKASNILPYISSYSDIFQLTNKKNFVSDLTIPKNNLYTKRPEFFPHIRIAKKIPYFHNKSSNK